MRKDDVKSETSRGGVLLARGVKINEDSKSAMSLIWCANRLVDEEVSVFNSKDLHIVKVNELLLLSLPKRSARQTSLIWEKVFTVRPDNSSVSAE